MVFSHYPLMDLKFPLKSDAKLHKVKFDVSRTFTFFIYNATVVSVSKERTDNSQKL